MVVQKSENAIANGNQKYFKEAFINGMPIRSFLDLGSHCVMIRESEAEQLNLSYQPAAKNSVIRGFGAGFVKPVGQLEANVSIDQASANVTIHVVPNSAQDIPLLIGQPFTEQPHITIVRRRNTVRLFEEKEDLQEDDDTLSKITIPKLPPQKVSLWAKEATVIPPNHVGFVQLTTGNELKGEELFLDSQFRFHEGKEHCFPRCVLAGDENEKERAVLAERERHQEHLASLENKYTDHIDQERRNYEAEKEEAVRAEREKLDTLNFELKEQLAIQRVKEKADEENRKRHIEQMKREMEEAVLSEQQLKETSLIEMEEQFRMQVENQKEAANKAKDEAIRVEQERQEAERLEAERMYEIQRQEELRRYKIELQNSLREEHEKRRELQHDLEHAFNIRRQQEKEAMEREKTEAIRVEQERLKAQREDIEKTYRKQRESNLADAEMDKQRALRTVRDQMEIFKAEMEQQYEARRQREKSLLESEMENAVRVEKVKQEHLLEVQEQRHAFEKEREKTEAEKEKLNAVKEEMEKYEAIKLLRKDQQKQRERYNLRRARTRDFQPGDLVVAARETPASSESKKKLLPRYKGPYVITEKLPADRYRIEDIPENQRTQRFYSNTAPVDKLKRYEILDETTDSDSSEEGKN